MKLRVACLLFGVSVALPVRAGDALTEALASIPGDALGFVCVPSIGGLDRDYQQAISDLGLQPFLQPPMNSLVSMLKQRMPMLEGLDVDGSLIVVFMPAENVFELMSKQALLIPAKEPRAVIDAMGGQATEGGLWTVTFMGQPYHVAIAKDRLIMGQQASVVKAVKEAKTSIGSKLKPEEKKAFEGLDLVLWMDADRLIKLVKPMLDGILAPMMAMQQSAGGLEAKSAAMNEKQLDMLTEGAASLAFGVTLDDSGLGLRFVMTSKPGSELGRQTRMKNTSGPLLEGVPATDYLVAFGQTADPAQTRAALKDLDAWFSMGEEVEAIDAAKLKQLQGLIEEAAPLLTGLRGSVQALPAGSNGLFGVSLIADTTDGKRAFELSTKLLELGMEMLVDAAAKTEDKWLKQLKDVVIFEKEAEEIAGVKVQHLKLDLGKVEEIDEEDVEAVTKVIGQEGVLFRMARVNPKTIVVGFGGGKARMAALIEQARKKESSLDHDAGIKKVAASLPKERAQVIYLAVDRILASVNRVMTALEEEPLPVQMPPLSAPLAMVGCGGDGWVRGDLFLPTELLVASKNAVMVMMGQMMAPPGAAPPPGSVESSAGYKQP